MATRPAGLGHSDIIRMKLNSPQGIRTHKEYIRAGEEHGQVIRNNPAKAVALARKMVLLKKKLLAEEKIHQLQLEIKALEPRANALAEQRRKIKEATRRGQSIKTPLKSDAGSVIIETKSALIGKLEGRIKLIEVTLGQ